MECPSPQGSALSCERMGLQASTMLILLKADGTHAVQEHALPNAIGKMSRQSLTRH